MGHIDKYRQGFRSTNKDKIDESIVEDDDEDDIELEPPRRITDRKYYFRIACLPFEEMHEKLKEIIATDRIGLFPITFARGNAYTMVLYDSDSNVINASAIKSRKKKHLIEGYDQLYKDLQKIGNQPLLHKIGNKASKYLISSIEGKGLEYQLTPPHDHR